MEVRLSETGFDSYAFLNFDSMNDLALYEIGQYQCPPSYGYGPAVRQRDIFHFVVSGYGKLYLGNEEYDIGPGQGFLIPANKQAYYEADKEQPWSYIWFHIGGSKLPDVFYQSGLSVQNPVFKPLNAPETIPYLYSKIVSNQSRELYCIGKMYEILDYIENFSSTKIESIKNLQLDYVRKVTNFVRLKYSEPIQVTDMANACGLNRSYLSRLFKEATGNSIQNYLYNYRMRIAAQLVSDTEQSIQDISVAVGYNDIFTFSKAFKKFYNVSPSEYRKKQANIS